MEIDKRSDIVKRFKPLRFQNIDLSDRDFRMVAGLAEKDEKYN